MNTKKRPASAATEPGHIPKQHATEYTATGTQSPAESGQIPREFIDDLVARSDLVEVVDQRLPIKKMGKNWTGICPFHGEKSPSFTVNLEKQFYYCFGCGAGGDAINFIMAFDGLPFREAVTHLARRLGLEVPGQGSYRPPRDGLTAARRRELKALLEQENHIVRFAQAAMADGETFGREDALRALAADDNVHRLRRLLCL